MRRADDDPGGVAPRFDAGLSDIGARLLDIEHPARARGARQKMLRPLEDEVPPRCEKQTRSCSLTLTASIRSTVTMCVVTLYSLPITVPGAVNVGASTSARETRSAAHPVPGYVATAPELMRSPASARRSRVFDPLLAGIHAAGRAASGIGDPPDRKFRRADPRRGGHWPPDRCPRTACSRSR